MTARTCTACDQQLQRIPLTARGPKSITDEPYTKEQTHACFNEECPEYFRR